MENKDQSLGSQSTSSASSSPVYPAQAPSTAVEPTTNNPPTDSSSSANDDPRAPDLSYKSTDLLKTKAYEKKEYFDHPKEDPRDAQKKLIIIISSVTLAIILAIVGIIILVKALTSSSSVVEESTESTTSKTTGSTEEQSEIAAVADESKNAYNDGSDDDAVQLDDYTISTANQIIEKCDQSISAADQDDTKTSLLQQCAQEIGLLYTNELSDSTKEFIRTQTIKYTNQLVALDASAGNLYFAAQQASRVEDSEQNNSYVEQYKAIPKDKSTEIKGGQ